MGPPVVTPPVDKSINLIDEIFKVLVHGHPYELLAMCKRSTICTAEPNLKSCP